MTKSEEIRSRNPFRDLLVTELIEDYKLYRQIFSEKILVGETQAVFQPGNAVLTGPQGTGKSMVLNLIRYPVISEWIRKDGRPPAPLRHLHPFFGISINLVRANFHTFGRRSVSRIHNRDRGDIADDLASAADFLNHYLFREFLKGVEFLLSDAGSRLRSWLGIRSANFRRAPLVKAMRSWDSWLGYYDDCNSLQDLLAKCDKRLLVWRSFLNSNVDTIPSEIWSTKSALGDPLHSMGNLLQSSTTSSARTPLFVVIDQYEVLPELNVTHGTHLQRVVNSLIKSRDPVVFYKIGARTYDWGKELRVWGSESRIEVQRDYVIIDLADVLRQSEDRKIAWLFPRFANDVAHNRLTPEGLHRGVDDLAKRIFGTWAASREAPLYLKVQTRNRALLKIPSDLAKQILIKCGKTATVLDLRLASAWALQRIERKIPMNEIMSELSQRPWEKAWWRKERVEVALIQLSSLGNRPKKYFGWDTVVRLSGFNISAFLLLCSEIWDAATKLDMDPTRELPLPMQVQSDGILQASRTWRNRDRNEQVGGRQRYESVGRLGAAIHDSLVRDLAISNPGHTGFSLKETDLSTDEKAQKLSGFIHDAVSWAILEERIHTSKQREDSTRRKWYLHPLLSPAFAIPFKRVKEPYYAHGPEVYDWFFGTQRIAFGKFRKSAQQNKIAVSQQLEMLL